MSHEFRSGHALVVGVGADLANTVDDALGLAGILKDPQRCAYPPTQVQVLTGEQATRAAVLAGLDQLAQVADAEATVVVYFSGHGYRVSSSMGEAYYLMPYGYDTQRLYQTAISGVEFTARLAAIPARKLLLLLDCCHAGGVGEAKAAGMDLAKAPLPPEALNLLAEGSGRVLIASSRDAELSYAGKPYSAFTLALVEALCGQGVAKQDGVVRVADLALHTREKVPGRTQGRQHPILHFEHADNFAVAYYAGGDTQPKGLPFAQTPEIEPAPGAWQGGISVGGDQIITTGPVATHGSAVNTGSGVAVAGSGNVIIAGPVSGNLQIGSSPFYPAGAPPAASSHSRPAAWDDTLTSLRDVLAMLYPVDDDARRIAAEAQMSTLRVKFVGQAVTTWHSLLQEAFLQGMIPAIIDVARAPREFQRNKALTDAADAYLARHT